MDLTDRAAELYALPLDEFIGARNAAAKEAAQHGDKDLAAAVRRLPKPAAAAWLVNMLVTRRRDEVEQVLELGASLKEAQASLDRAQLHALGQQRQRLLAAVAHQSLDAAAEAGHDVGPAALPGVEQTLRAALADPAAAAAVLTGRLVRTLEASGWDAVDLEDAVAGPFTPPAPDDDGDDDGSPSEKRPSAPQSAGRKPSAADRQKAQARLDAARDALTDAQEAAATTERAARRLSVRRDGLVASVEDLEERLDALRRELADLEAEAARHEAERLAAERSIEEAERAERSARTAFDELLA
ncbi:transposase [Arthrobacter cheniae]|uniref:Transposase n=1 Tax=Arthrobacter cheniae TaxID=1258888 RepID=A0A3A5MBL1_9MICC|nr:transposase [Arthrobacter cheniae]RJT77973.1 transposase [Arthrobacter cheniae]